MKRFLVITCLAVQIAAATPYIAAENRKAAKDSPLVAGKIPAKYRGAVKGELKKVGLRLANADWCPESGWVVVELYAYDLTRNPDVGGGSPPFAKTNVYPKAIFFPVGLIAVHVRTQKTGFVAIKDQESPSSLAADLYCPAFHLMGNGCVAVRVRTKHESGKLETVFWKWDLRRKTITWLGLPRVELVSLARTLNQSDYEIEWPAEGRNDFLKTVKLQHKTRAGRSVSLPLPVPAANSETRKLYPLIAPCAFVRGRRRNSIIVFDNCHSQVSLWHIGDRIRKTWTHRAHEITKQKKSEARFLFPVDGFVGPSDRIPIWLGPGERANDLLMLHATKGTCQRIPKVYGPLFDEDKSKSSATGSWITLKWKTSKGLQLVNTANARQRAVSFKASDALVGLRKNGDLILSTDRLISVHSVERKGPETVLFKLPDHQK